MIPTMTIKEARVLGSLLEKEVTTPEQYPLSLNGLTNACNQKSNRDPVMKLTEDEVQGALDLLKAKHWVMMISGQRTLKFKQRFCNTEFSDFQFSEQEKAILCLLLLRGAQTLGELKTRCQRMAEFDRIDEVEQSISQLMTHASGAFVTRLTKEPGRREVRYAHLLTELDERYVNDQDNIIASQALNQESKQPDFQLDSEMPSLLDRLESLEQRVKNLESLVSSDK